MMATKSNICTRPQACTHTHMQAYAAIDTCTSARTSHALKDEILQTLHAIGEMSSCNGCLCLSSRKSVGLKLSSVEGLLLGNTNITTRSDICTRPQTRTRTHMQAHVAIDTCMSGRTTHTLKDKILGTLHATCRHV